MTVANTAGAMLERTSPVLECGEGCGVMLAAFRSWLLSFMAVRSWARFLTSEVLKPTFGGSYGLHLVLVTFLWSSSALGGLPLGLQNLLYQHAS